MSQRMSAATRDNPLPARLTRKKALSVFVDITRFSHLSKTLPDDDAVVLFLDGFYDLVADHLEPAGGDVIKYMSDACMVLFDEDRAEQALEALAALRSAFAGYCQSRGAKPTDLRAAVTLGGVVVGTFGRNAIRDVLGLGAAEAITMTGSGITISEAVYRKLPSASRSPWRKKSTTVTYHHA